MEIIALTLASNNQKVIVNLENVAHITGNNDKSKSVVYFNSQVRIIVVESFNEITKKIEEQLEKAITI